MAWSLTAIAYVPTGEVRDVAPLASRSEIVKPGPTVAFSRVACAQAALGSRTATTATVAMQSARIRWFKPSPSDRLRLLT